MSTPHTLDHALKTLVGNLLTARVLDVTLYDDEVQVACCEQRARLMNRQPTPADHALYTRLDEDHKIRIGYRHRLATVVGYDISCACGYTASVESRSQQPAWELIDAHLAAQVPADVAVMACWCSRLAIRVEGTGTWYHLERTFMGHRAFESRYSQTLGDEAYAAWLADHEARPVPEGDE